MPQGPPPILVHVPKSGGTTLIMAVTGGKRPPPVGDAYRHVYWNVDRTRMHSNAGNLFTDDGVARYRGRTRILTVRRPLDRLESEFGFLGNREEFRDLWKTMSGTSYPQSFRDFIEQPGATDATTKFLLGRDLYDPTPVEDADVERIIRHLRDEEFVFGLTEEMPSTMRNIQSRCGIDFDRTLTRYRTSLYKPERDPDWSAIEEAFARHNRNDLRVHAEVSRRFARQVDELPPGDAPIFEGGRYDSVFLFTSGGNVRTPFEIFINDLGDPAECYAWIDQRRERLMAIQQDAIRSSDRDPRRFLVTWLHAVARNFPELDLDVGSIDESDPLSTVQRLCRSRFG